MQVRIKNLFVRRKIIQVSLFSFSLILRIETPILSLVYVRKKEKVCAGISCML